MQVGNFRMSTCMQVFITDNIFLHEISELLQKGKADEVKEKVQKGIDEGLTAISEIMADSQSGNSVREKNED